MFVYSSNPMCSRKFQKYCTIPFSLPPRHTSKLPIGSRPSINHFIIIGIPPAMTHRLETTLPYFGSLIKSNWSPRSIGFPFNFAWMLAERRGTVRLTSVRLLACKRKESGRLVFEQDRQMESYWREPARGRLPSDKKPRKDGPRTVGSQVWSWSKLTEKGRCLELQEIEKRRVGWLPRGGRKGEGDFFVGSLWPHLRWLAHVEDKPQHRQGRLLFLANGRQQERCSWDDLEPADTSVVSSIIVKDTGLTLSPVFSFFPHSTRLAYSAVRKLASPFFGTVFKCEIRTSIIPSILRLISLSLFLTQRHR